MLAGVFLIRMRQQNEVIRARKMARPLYEIHSIRVRRPTAYGGFYTSTKVIPTSIFTSSLAIMKWLLRAEETGHQRDRQETRSQEGHAVVPRRLLQPSFRQCGHTRLGPRRQRLTRAEWKGQQEYAIKIAAAESAVLDSAAQREDERSEAREANADAAALLAKREAQSTRSSRASQRCNAGSEATASSGDCEI